MVGPTTTREALDMETLMLSTLGIACFGFGWIVGHIVGYEKGRDEWPR